MAAQCEEGFVLHISFVSISRPSANRFDSQAHECDNSLEELYGYAADGAGGQGVLSDLSEVLAVAELGRWKNWKNIFIDYTMIEANNKIELWMGLNEDWLHQIFDYDVLTVELFEGAIWWWQRLGSKTKFDDVPRFWKNETWNDFNGFNLKLGLNSDPKISTQSLSEMLANEVKHRAGLSCQVPSFANYQLTIGTEVKIPAMELPLSWTERQAVDFFKVAYRNARDEAGYQKVSNARNQYLRRYFEAVEAFDRRFHLGEDEKSIGVEKWREYKKTLKEVAARGVSK
jgi:hypothetical protein